MTALRDQIAALFTRFRESKFTPSESAAAQFEDLLSATLFTGNRYIEECIRGFFVEFIRQECTLRPDTKFHFLDNEERIDPVFRDVSAGSFLSERKERMVAIIQSSGLTMLFRWTKKGRLKGRRLFIYKEELENLLAAGQTKVVFHFPTLGDVADIVIPISIETEFEAMSRECGRINWRYDNNPTEC